MNIIMKTFIGTTIFRIVVLLWGRIYVSNYQSDALYNFLNMSNPATKAVTECYSGVWSLGSGLNAKLDMILQKVDWTNSLSTGNTISTSGTVKTTDTLNQVFFTSGSKSN